VPAQQHDLVTLWRDTLQDNPLLRRRVEQCGS
jgi:hypothetical protein